jgi:hypothetical protein
MSLALNTIHPGVVQPLRPGCGGHVVRPPLMRRFAQLDFGNEPVPV